MAPMRLNRAEFRDRLVEVPRWILDELLDVFEVAALRALEQRREADKKTDGKAARGRKGAANERRS